MRTEQRDLTHVACREFRADAPIGSGWDLRAEVLEELTEWLRERPGVLPLCITFDLSNVVTLQSSEGTPEERIMADMRSSEVVIAMLVYEE